jgi:hypothetical protein
VTDIGVDRVGEVEWRRSGGEILDLALRREDEDLVLEEVDLERIQERLGSGVALVLDQLAKPGHLLLARIAGGGPLLVDHMRRDPVLGQLVHLRRPDLDLERATLGSDHGGVEGLVGVRLRHRDEVLETAG